MPPSPPRRTVRSESPLRRRLRQVVDRAVAGIDATIDAVAPRPRLRPAVVPVRAGRR